MADTKKNNALQKPLTPWEYIKKNNLQNPENKREIIADAKLKPIFGGKDKVSMFEMNKHLAQHLK